MPPLRPIQAPSPDPRGRILVAGHRQISRPARPHRLQGVNTRHAVIDSSLGELTLVAQDDALTGLYFRHHWYRPTAETLGRRVDAKSDELLAKAQTQLTDYLAGRRHGFNLPTRPNGDEAQERIWQLLTTIPYGETVTYGELAAALADGTTAQEVGQAVGRNPLSIIVPCHRVVGKNGQLTGYAGGLKRKQFLLELEEPSEVKAARLF
jgi:methylated-DNA-[protein]-cysteine S-methyltransferase